MLLIEAIVAQTGKREFVDADTIHRVRQQGPADTCLVIFSNQTDAVYRETADSFVARWVKAAEDGVPVAVLGQAAPRAVPATLTEAALASGMTGGSPPTPLRLRRPAGPS